MSSARAFSPAHSLHRRLASVLTVLLLLGSGCSGDDDDDTASPAGGAGAATSCGGPVKGEADGHCVDDTGTAITQEIGECQTDAPAAGGAGADTAEEPFEVRYNTSAFDDDCKYETSFESPCLAVNEPATFKLTLARKAGDEPAGGAVPDSSEIYLADDPSHISPSNQIHAPEGPDGTYEVGPIIFDRSGRWVVRFHFFEECSDVPEDSPHGHVAFYVDVP